MEDNDRTRNDEGPNWGTKDQSGNVILKMISFRSIGIKNHF